MPAVTRFLLLAASFTGLAACAAAGPQDLTPRAAGILQADSAKVAAAARAHDASRLGPALQQLRADVSIQRRHGDLGGARAQRILDAAARIARDALRPVTPPTPAAPAGSNGDQQGGADSQDDDGD